MRRPPCSTVLAGALVALGLGVSAALPAEAQAPPTATVRGLVVDARTTAPITGAVVSVQGIPLRTATGADGRFALTGVPVGDRTLRVAAIGFAPVTQPITVPANGLIVDIAMEPAVVVLDELVATATGEQARRSVASAIGTIQTDSIARFAAVTSVDQVLAARVPGVSVLPQSGVTGGTFSVRIRGANSIQLYNEPLWIIDGVRLANGGWSFSGDVWDNIGLGALNPDDIESMDIIKGPAAAALYGTQASNGVIVLKTKRGRAGKVAWDGYAEYGWVEQPAEWNENWWSWGRNLVNGVPQAAAVQCRLTNAATGRCVIDSLTTFNPLGNPETTPYADPGYRTLFGVQASGGTEKLRFFASLERENEQGPYTMPSAEITRITTTRGVAPTEAQIHPNHLDQFNLRGNFTATLAPTLELTMSGAYTSRWVQTPSTHYAFQNLAIQNEALSAPGYRTAFNGYTTQHLGDMMSLEVVDEESRGFLSANATWTPRSWLTASLTSGIDRGGTHSWVFAKNGEGPNGQWLTGVVGQGGGRYTANLLRQTVTTDLLATGTWEPTPGLTSRTALGGQYVLDQWDYLESYGANLPPGDVRLNNATVKASAENWSEEATLGFYLEEGLAWRDRVFLTLGIRTDENSQFGAGYPRVWYPRAGISWVLSEEGFFPRTNWLTSLRLRGAWGRAGIQPGSTTALQTLGSGAVVSGGQTLSTLRLTSLGNPDLRPEVISELEFGFDLQLFRDRLHVEATWYDKRSKDGLGTISLPPSLGAAQQRTVNISSVQNRGFELAVDGQAVRSPAFSWNLRVTGSTLHNEILDLGDLPQPFGTFRAVEGYPVYGFWARPITGYADANGDGILVEGEVTSDTAWRYIGPQLPTRELALTNTFGFFRDRLTLMAMLDYRGGYYRWWNQEQIRCSGNANCRAANDPAAPLDEQAAAVAVQSAVHKFTNDGYIKPGDFVRLREVSVAWALPAGVTRPLRMNAATLVVAGRNLLMVSKKYPGIEPETSINNQWGPVGQTNASPQDNKFTIPPLRYWIVRLNLAF